MGPGFARLCGMGNPNINYGDGEVSAASSSAALLTVRPWKGERRKANNVWQLSTRFCQFYFHRSIAVFYKMK